MYVTYFLMLSTSKLSGIQINKARLLTTSSLGGIYSLIILLEITVIEQVIIKIIMGLTLIIIGFVGKDVAVKINELIKSTIYFTITNFIYAGIMFSIFIVVAPKSMAYKNGVVYFNITALNLVISTIIAYLIVNILTRVLDKKIKSEDKAIITINFFNREVVLIGLIDTGNKLNDIFTGLPVIVCEYEGVRDLFPDKLQNYFKETNPDLLENTSYKTKLRLVPVNVVGAKVLLPAFKPDNLLVGSTKREVIVAVTNQKLSSGEFNAII